MKKSILIISNMYPSKKYPHYGVFVENCSKILENAGYRVNVVGLQKNDNKIAKTLSYASFFCKSIFRGLFGKYDAIYGHYASHVALPILIIRKLIKVKVIINVHGNDIVPETANDYRYLRLVHKLLSVANYYIAPSQYFKDILINEYGCDEKLIVVYPSGGVDSEVFHPIDKQEARHSLNIDQNYNYVGYVSRIEKNKGWDIFLYAIAGLMEEDKKIRAIVVGDGNEIPEYDDLVERLTIKDKIIKYDLLPQHDIANIFNALDVFVFPTYRKSESLGLVGLEAMACGTKVVLPNKYGPASYGNDGYNCFQFLSGDERSLSVAIKKALESDNKIIAGALRTAEQYSLNNTESVLLGLFKNILNC